MKQVSIWIGCMVLATNINAQDLPADQHATSATINLYRNMKQLVHTGILFGHQDALAYGVGWKYVPGRSDVKTITGDYPAVYGWDLGHIENDAPVNLDSVPFDKIKQFIGEAYSRGGVSTVSWHGNNPLNGQSAWDTATGTVASILPGGARHALYKTWLDKMAAFFSSLKGKQGESIPVLFRPFHELTGNWFWWCRNNCTPEQFKQLWRFTVTYLREEKQLHNLLYVFNTADFTTAADFLLRYPGDDVVDILSFDSYQYNDPQKDNGFVKDVDRRLGIIDSIAASKHKIAAFAETGYETIPYANWWTNTLWSILQKHKLSYVLVWRNAGLMPTGKMHYYVPTKTDVSAADFIKFYQLPGTLFEKEVAKRKLYAAESKK